ncbi:MAG TPA: hypothetical protein VLK29_11455 [Luteimonas sp.]|nr:hypothetical protein [Luteimonas sp.]
MSRERAAAPRFDPAALSNAELDARLRALRQAAFDLFEHAAQSVDARDDRTAHARAERKAAPLIEEARLLNDERVRRLRARARRWRTAATATAIGGGTVVLALVAMRG